MVQPKYYLTEKMQALANAIQKTSLFVLWLFKMLQLLQARAERGRLLFNNSFIFNVPSVWRNLEENAAQKIKPLGKTSAGISFRRKEHLFPPQIFFLNYPKPKASQDTPVSEGVQPHVLIIF